MRKLFLCLLLACTAIMAKAYVNYFVEGTTWHMLGYIDPVDPADWGYKWKIYSKGSENIDGETAIKLWIEDRKGNTELWGYFKTEGDKVFFLTPEVGEWKPAYDFGMQIEDTGRFWCQFWPNKNADDGCYEMLRLPLEYFNPKTLSDPDLIALQNNDCEVVGEYRFGNYWIPGIGNVAGPLRNVFPQLDGGPGSKLDWVENPILGTYSVPSSSIRTALEERAAIKANALGNGLLEIFMSTRHGGKETLRIHSLEGKVLATVTVGEEPVEVYLYAPQMVIVENGVTAVKTMVR